MAKVLFVPITMEIILNYRCFVLKLILQVRFQNLKSAISKKQGILLQR